MDEKAASGPFLRWRDSFSVGIKVLDDDHRLLVQLINAACVAWHDGCRADALRVLKSLTAAAEAHFEREEDVLRQLGRGTPAQTVGGGHRERVAQLAALCRRLEEAEGGDAGRRACEDLVNWFLREVIGRDAAIKAHFDDGAERYFARGGSRKVGQR